MRLEGDLLVLYLYELKNSHSLRYFIDLAYLGKAYHGWQIQPNAISVQEEVERVLSTLLREEIKVMGAGRTDTGVHARQLVAHFDSDEVKDPNELCFRANAFLPADIAFKAIYAVREDAHARFDATSRTYQYHLSFHKDPFTQDLAYRAPSKPDLHLMNQAAAIMMEYQDFEAFSRTGSDVKTFLCNISHAQWSVSDQGLIFTITADRFLRNMVRAVVGTLLEVGLGKCSLEAFRAIIESKDRSRAGASAPAHGLYLTAVNYPDNIRSNGK